MSGQVRRSLALALAGLLGGLGLVLALFGGESVRRMIGRPGTEPPAASAPAPSGSLRGLADPGTQAGRAGPPIDFRDDTSSRTQPQRGAPDHDVPGRAGDAQPSAAEPGASLPETRTARLGTPGKPAAAEPDAADVPRFDIVRVEPNGDAVVAGRGAPDAVVEMLVDGKPVARAVADASGQFALVPPALPTGSSEIRLRMTGKDGRATTSRQSVAVDVAPGRDRKPLVALTAPDAATVVLSQPGTPGSGARTADAASSGKSGEPAAGHGKTQPTRIVSVDVQDNGRLYVTATGNPGAKLRLYLNDTLIAPGSIGPDGRASFTIGRGVKPGQYQVRIDQIDPGTGKVGARAEVPLSVPQPAAIAAREPTPSRTAGRPGTLRGDDTRSAQADALETTVGPVPGGGAGAPAPGPAQSGSLAAETSARPDPNRLAAETGGPAGSVFVPEISTAKISRGDNLWRISQRTYGRGERYTVIYDANQGQIRDPDLIYPGQIFVLPADKRG